MSKANNSAYDDYVNEIKLASLEQQREELEVRLGQARLEGDNERVIEIETELAQVQTELKPTLSFEPAYPKQLEEEAYHGLAGEIVISIEPHSEADTIALLMNLLAAFGNVIGNSSWFMVGVERHFPKLFCVIVGDTAKGRKGTSWQPIFKLFEEVEPEWTRRTGFRQDYQAVRE